MSKPFDGLLNYLTLNGFPFATLNLILNIRVIGKVIRLLQFFNQIPNVSGVVVIKWILCTDVHRHDVRASWQFVIDRLDHIVCHITGD